MNGTVRTGGWGLMMLLFFTAFAWAQSEDPGSFVESGKLSVAGKMQAYRIRHLPVQSFPQLPEKVANVLHQRGCLIPQTYEARRPENVVQASLERAGTSDWAVLCSVKGSVTLLVFFASAPAHAMELAEYSETQRLQSRMGSDVLGFNWGIDPASPESIHQAQIGLSPRPPRLDHDALADSVIDHTTVYHYYRKGVWTLVDVPRE